MTYLLIQLFFNIFLTELNSTLPNLLSSKMIVSLMVPGFKFLVYVEDDKCDVKCCGTLFTYTSFIGITSCLFGKEGLSAFVQSSNSDEKNRKHSFSLKKLKGSEEFVRGYVSSSGQKSCYP